MSRRRTSPAKTPASLGSLTIGQVARKAGVGIETIRFYEREGILEAPPRRESGYREFPPDAVSRIRFIKRAQELGFSLREIAELLQLRVNPKENCSPVKKRAESKLAEIESKIRDLEQMKRILKTVTKACDASRPISDCPILKAFEERPAGRTRTSGEVK